MQNFTRNRHCILKTIPSETLISREDIYARMHPSSGPFGLAATDQRFLAFAVDRGLIESYPDKKKRRYLYRRTDKGSELLSLLGELPFDLSQRRLFILQSLSERAAFSRREIGEFLSENYEFKVMSTSDQKSLQLLEEFGFLTSFRDPEGHQKYLYRRTEKGTKLLSILGILPET